MHGHFVETKVWSSWAAFFRSYRDAFLAVGTTFMSKAEAEIEDTFAVAIHVLGPALFASDGVLVFACLDDDLEAAITCSQRTSMMTAYDLRDPLTLTLSSAAVCHFILGIKGVCYPTFQLWDPGGATLGMLEGEDGTLAWQKAWEPTLGVLGARVPMLSSWEA